MNFKPVKINPSAADILSRPCGHLNPHLKEDVPAKKKRGKKVSKEKEWIVFKLNEYAKEMNLDLSREYMFDFERDWRFDWCFLSLRIAFEYEGIVAKKSRHTTLTGFTGDTEKYNAAQQKGWKVLRFTALNYLDLVIELNNLIKRE